MGGTAGRVGLGVMTGGLSEAVRPLTKNLMKTPSPPEAPPQVTTDSPAVQQAAADASKRRTAAKGYRSTMVSMMRSVMDPNSPALKQTYGS